MLKFTLKLYSKLIFFLVMAPKTLSILGFLAFTCSLALASDNISLQDFCVADTPNKQVHVNGFTCMEAKAVQASDFFMSGFHIVGNTSNPFGSKVTPATVTQIPGLNTLGISMVRIDLAPFGLNPPHIHPRGSEILTVLEGKIEVGFITSTPENRLISQILNPGDVFVFPIGLIHYQRNNGSTKAVALGALNSQNAGTVSFGSSIFGSTPEIPTDLLGKALQVDYNIISQIKDKF